MKFPIALTWFLPSKCRRICGGQAIIDAGLFLAVSIVVLMSLASFSKFAGALLVFPYQVMEAEGLVLWMGLTLLGGASPYQDPGSSPWVVAVYGPLFPLLSGAAASAVGITAGAGRGVSLGAAIGCCWLIAWLIRAEALRESHVPGGRAVWLVAAIAAGSYLVSPYVYEWSPLARVDMLMVMFSLLAIAASQQAEHDKPRRWMTLAGLFCVLALWTKQTALAAPAAIALWLALRYGFRRALAFASVVAAVAALGYLVLDLWSNGGFVQSAIAANALPWSPRVLADLWRRTILLHGWFLAGAALYVWSTINKRRPGLLIIYLGASGVLTVSAGHTGAAMNYFLELLAAATVCGGLAWARMVSDARWRLAPAVATGGLLLQLLWFPVADLSPLAPLFERSREWGYFPTTQDARLVGEIEQLARSRGGPLLSEDPLLNLRTRQQVFAIPASALRALSDDGQWGPGQRELVEGIGSRRFSTIVLTRQDYPAAVLSAIDQHYQLTTEAPNVVAGYRVYVPRS